MNSEPSSIVLPDAASDRVVDRDPRGGGLGWLALALLLALGLRAGEAANKSLWLDELHSLTHARAGSAAAVCESLRPDFHAPLFFLLLHPIAELNPHLLRFIPILLGLLGLVPLLLIAREAGWSRWARVVVAIGFAVIPFQIQYGTELRPYAPLATAAAFMVWAAVTTRGSHRLRFVVLTLAVALGLYTHYLAAFAGVGAGVASLLAWRRKSPPTLGPWRAGAAIALGAALFLPWVLYDERWVFKKPELALGSAKIKAVPVEVRVERNRGELLQVPLRSVLPMRDGLGTPWNHLAMVGAGGVLLVLAFGLLRGLAGGRERTGLRRSLWAMVGGGVASALLLAAASAIVWNRVAVQYFAISAWMVPLLLGAAIEGLRSERNRKMAVIGILVLGSISGVAHVVGAPREGLDRAVARAREWGAGRPSLYTAVLNQPVYFPHLEVYRAYAPDLPMSEPKSVPPARTTGDQSRVLVITRTVHPEKTIWAPAFFEKIKEGRVLVAHEQFAGPIELWVYDPAP